MSDYDYSIKKAVPFLSEGIWTSLSVLETFGIRDVELETLVDAGIAERRIDEVIKDGYLRGSKTYYRLVPKK